MCDGQQWKLRFRSFFAKYCSSSLSCKKGDWVIFARYAGSRIQIDGGEVRLLNDDEVLATIDNPEDILHQY